MGASHQPESEDDLDHARPALIAEHRGGRPGETITLGVTFEIDPGWHIYWIGLNDTGFPTTFDWSLPEGFAVGAIGWPVPKRYATPELSVLDHIYEDRVTHLVPLTIPESAEPGTAAEIRVAVEWLVCREACIPGFAELSIEVPILEPGSEPRMSAHAPWIREARASLPRIFDSETSPVRLVWSGRSALVEVAGADTVAFYPHDSSAELASALRDGLSDDNTLRLELGKVDAERPRLRGVVHAWNGRNETLGAWWIDEPVPGLATEAGEAGALPVYPSPERGG